MSTDITSSTAMEVATVDGNELLKESRAIIMGLLTVPTCRSFLSVARLSVHCIDGWVIHEFLIIVHGHLIIVRPWTTSLSSMGDFVVHEPYSRSRTLISLLGWFLNLFALLGMDNPYGRIGDELISRYPITHTHTHIYIYIYIGHLA